MDRAELVELLSPEGLRLLDSLPEWDSKADVVRAVADLRKAGHSPSLVAAVLSQARLRQRARAKFGEFAERMLFTEAGLEQATRLKVAALHAGRFARAGIGHVADLGCGIGGDALAMAAVDLEITAAEADEVTAAIAAYNLTPFPRAQVRHALAEEVPLGGIGGAWLDPARRTTEGGRTTRLADASAYSPSLDFAFGLAERVAVGVKLGPGTDRDVVPAGAEAQWVSVDGDLVELAVWFGPLARPGIGRAALVIRGDQAAELAAAADSEDAPTGPLGDYLYEPDGAVIRARLIGDFARANGGWMVSEGIAYVTADRVIESPFARGFRVLERLPNDERQLRQALAQRGIGTLEIKKRGVDVDPATLRTRLKLRGEASATIVITREAGRRVTLLVERL
ncbi:class I SAM-dependent methyltransferase [Agromyces aerolatus]|uniref:class I SAM-dependent methyltransferase n=1 Tax=Agromyces sp. LY-1074 TaxID=3074080 RepID=UPI0028561B11|nr:MULTISPECIES: SAM-dependent methyltransferase [unclassified Agromyces]MDR5698353.1 SAM-dependent methyltransferase [Agromyces sp. LY-1074]MDR5704647.1 SAM-dependent methyltransferase [Agromyces sp. LY-1358]